MKQLDTLIQQNDRLYVLLQEKLPQCCLHCRKKRKSKRKKSRVEEHTSSPITVYTEDQLMTIDMAVAEMKVSRSKIYQLIKVGRLQKLNKDGGSRLIAAEVMEAKKWYSVPKGKI